MLPDRVPSNDKGNDVQFRFRYQHSYTCLIAILMYSRQIDFKEIFCEQHEDILGISSSGKYTGIQIKTREDLAPFSLHDESIKKSIKRFMKLEEKYSNHFTDFFIVSNCGFTDDLKDCIEIISNPKLYAYQTELRTRIKKYIQKISEECKTKTSITRRVLRKLTIQTGPALDGVDSKIIESHLGNLPECKNLNLEDLRQILAQIRELVYNASTRRFSDSVNDHISFLIDGSRTAKEIEIEGKRITESDS